MIPKMRPAGSLMLPDFVTFVSVRKRYKKTMIAMNRLFSLILMALVLTLQGYAQKSTGKYVMQRDLSYLHPGEQDAYKSERCKLDLYYPEDKPGFATLVWFHGGGLEGGQKHIPQEFLRQGYAVATVNYRLSPRAHNPAYTEDAAEAVAWVFEHIAEYGGDTAKIYIAGHSAGGYLCLMLNLDKRYLGKWGIDANRLAGAFPISGQTTTHYTIRKERGLPSANKLNIRLSYRGSEKILSLHKQILFIVVLSLSFAPPIFWAVFLLLYTYPVLPTFYGLHFQPTTIRRYLSNHSRLSFAALSILLALNDKIPIVCY